MPLDAQPEERNKTIESPIQLQTTNKQKIKFPINRRGKPKSDRIV